MFLSPWDLGPVTVHKSVQLSNVDRHFLHFSRSIWSDLNPLRFVDMTLRLSQDYTRSLAESNTSAISFWGLLISFYSCNYNKDIFGAAVFFKHYVYNLHFLSPITIWVTAGLSVMKIYVLYKEYNITWFDAVEKHKMCRF